MPVIFEADDTVTVDVDHGVYTVTRSCPAENWHYRTSAPGHKLPYAELEMYRDGQVRLVRGMAANQRAGRFPLELLDVLVLAALAFRRRDAERLAS